VIRGKVDGMGEKLNGQQILDAGVDDWRLLGNSLHTRFATEGFQKGLDLVNAIGAAAEEMDHHPDLDLRWGHLNVQLSSHDTGGVTERDLKLARRISELAAGLGVEARPGEVQSLELALDTAEFAKVKPFWKAVLGLDDNPALPDELADGGGALPTVWFQKTEPHDPPRQRFHLDIHVPHDVAEERIKAALEAGGTLVSESEAPSFTVLADADGNKACVCTWQGRVPGED
jgi:4a-hydroxytetrahydrobiopterin dehydratase